MYNSGESADFKNNIIAQNDSYYTSTKDFKVYAGTVNDNGYNIVGPSESFDWGQTDGGWEDDNGDGTFTLYSIGTTGSLNLDTAADNTNQYGTYTYAILENSIAIDNGSDVGQKKLNILRSG